MAIKETADSYDMIQQHKLFDVTCVVGSVYSGGDENPHVLAFRMIGEHGVDGYFTFLNENGHTVHVTVETEVPK